MPKLTEFFRLSKPATNAEYYFIEHLTNDKLIGFLVFNTAQSYVKTILLSDNKPVCYCISCAANRPCKAIKILNRFTNIGVLPVEFYSVPNATDVKKLSIEEISSQLPAWSVFACGELEKLKKQQDELMQREETKKKLADSKISQPWLFKDIPDPKDFFVQEPDWKTASYCIYNKKNFLLTGPKGQGKSEFVYRVAEAHGYNVVSIPCGATQEPRLSLIGNTHFDKDQGTWFEESRFVKAIQTPNTVILLDELSRISPDAGNMLLTLLDKQGYLALDESDETKVIKKHEDVVFAATANIGAEYTAADTIDAALLDRFGYIIDVEFPSYQAEVNLLVNRCGIKEKFAKNLVQFANDQRAINVQGEMNVSISTRQLLAAGDAIANGFTLEESIQFAIINHFSKAGQENSDRTQLSQLMQKYIKIDDD